MKLIGLVALWCLSLIGLMSMMVDGEPIRASATFPDQDQQQQQPHRPSESIGFYVDQSAIGDQFGRGIRSGQDPDDLALRVKYREPFRLGKRAREPFRLGKRAREPFRLGKKSVAVPRQILASPVNF